ncbi:hypothetical protein C0992_007697 [Termitomyces sp. T32_za158]|nr:hypothetical protein C0992_007697 [Termitomyces sp. T32_za158]
MQEITLNDESVREEDIMELRPIAPGLAYHDPSSANPDRSIPISPQTLSQHHYRGRLQDGMADFFEKLNYHTVSVEELCAMFGTAVDYGLDNVAAAYNIRRDGKNTIAKKPYFRDLWEIVDYFVLRISNMLLIGLGLSFVVWQRLRLLSLLSLVILLIIIILCRASFFALQAWSTSRIMNSILYLIPSECVVIREGRTNRLHTADLAVGDIVVLSVGNKVPADMRLIEASDDLRFDRSVLTGESEEIEGTVESRGEAFLEARNIALMNTHITNGHAKGVVVLTGDRTVISRISKLKDETQEKNRKVQREIGFFNLIAVIPPYIL